jgi:hypothetical protein
MSRRGNDPHPYPQTVVCVNETKDAVKVTPVQAKNFEPFWVPKSVLHDDSEVYQKGDEGTLIVLEWFALKEEWD